MNWISRCEGPRQTTPLPPDCRGALSDGTSYWAFVVANPLGHMSHQGARGTRWTAGHSQRVDPPG